MVVTATDGVTSATKTLVVGTAKFPLDLYDNGSGSVGVGLGATAEANKVRSSMPIVLNNNAGIKNYDSGGNEMFMLNYNGSNLWVGGRTNQMTHFLGKTYICSGYNTTDLAGNESVYISVPNAGNTDANYYKIYHEGFNPMVGFIDHISWASGTHNIDDAPNGLVWINWSNATISSANTIPFSSGYGWLLTVGNRFQFYFKHGSSGIQGMWVRDYTTDSISHWFAWTQIGGGGGQQYVNGDEVSF